MNYSIGSLFDGSGGFPLAGTLCGIEPRWASEVEPYPIAVTRSRFPNMKHLGDISKINGAEIEPVDVITFGSPCQDLSVAGKQAGMKHESNGDSETTRSGLFIEAVRIIKEMRRATNGQYPKFAVWENVPGAFSSNKGEDFRTVLEEIIQIVEPSAPSVPAPDKKGWAYADCLMGDGWSIAYRVFDTQYWPGTPQRRKRIYLVADFTGESAEKVLFEREGLRGYFAESGSPWKRTPAEAPKSSGATDEASTYVIDNIGGQAEYGKPSPVNSTLRSGALGAVAYAVENHPNDSRVNLDESGKVQTLTSRMGTGGGNVPMVLEPFCKSSRGKYKGDAETWKPAEISNTLNTFDVGEARANELVAVYCLQGNGIDRADTAGCNGKGWREDASYTLNTIDRPAVAYAIDQGGGKSSARVSENKAPTLTCTHDGAPAVVYALDRSFFNQGQNALYMPQCYEDGTNPTLLAKGPSAVAYEDGTYTASKASFFTRGAYERADCLVATDYKDPPIINSQDEGSYIVRRLTPTECARLQGFADWWSYIEPKESLTDSEHSFWQEVRNTHAAINGKTVKDYTKEQMLSWYNKLHSDNAEYKMWGNGIALPPSLYVMQGIADALKEKRAA